MKVQKYHVVIVGGGGSGMFAAIEARKHGKKVALLEKNPHLGGTTIWSIGSVSTSCSPFQTAEGIFDTPSAHYEDMAKFHGKLANRDNPELRRILVENVPETFRQLLDMGLTFMGPMPEPPHRVPRMHNVLPNSRAYGYHIGRAVRRAGVNIFLQTSAKELIIDDGAVVGVRAEDHSGEPVEFLAENGVVLAAGDYSNAREMKAQYASENIADISAIVQTSTGDGHRLGLEVGAQMVNGDLFGGPQIRFIAPRHNIVQMIPPYKPIALAMRWAMKALPDRLLRPLIMMFVTTMLEPQKGLFEAGAILVNKNGERFCDECDEPQFHIHEQADGEAFIVLDEALASRFSAWPDYVSTAPGVAYAYMPDYRRNRPDVYTVARDVDDAARKLGFSTGALRNSIDQGNTNTSGSKQKLSNGPYHILGPVKSWIVVTEGGLKINSHHEVIGPDDRPIPGLFSAGTNGQGGIVLEGHGHHLGWAFTSGRLAGRRASFFDRSVLPGGHESQLKQAS